MVSTSALGHGIRALPCSDRIEILADKVPVRYALRDQLERARQEIAQLVIVESAVVMRGRDVLETGLDRLERQRAERSLRQHLQRRLVRGLGGADLRGEVDPLPDAVGGEGAIGVLDGGLQFRGRAGVPWRRGCCFASPARRDNPTP